MLGSVLGARICSRKSDLVRKLILFAEAFVCHISDLRLTKKLEFFFLIRYNSHTIKSTF